MQKTRLRRRPKYAILITRNIYRYTTENTIQCNNTQDIDKKRNTRNEAANAINLNPSNITKYELVREDTSNTKSTPSIQPKEHKQFAFIIGHSMIKL